MGFLSSVGGLLNDVTGATSAGKQSQKYALQSAKVNNKYQKEFAKNAHQWEVEDLKKAGLNPVLSANSGASASGGGVSSGSVSNSGINPIETAIGAWNGYEQARNTGADTNRKNAETANIEADTLLKEYQQLTEIAKKDLTETQRQEIIELLEAKKKEILANAKFQNERARGFSESESWEGGIEAEGGASLKKGIHAGASVKGGHSSSRTW